MKSKIKRSIICKNINLTNYLINENNILYHIPSVGDVAIFKVVSIGKHKQIQADSKRNMLILPGDLIMAAFGTRYATSQFEGYLPTNYQREFHILGAGGTIGIVHSMHSLFQGAGPTKLTIVGYVTDHSGRVVNTKRLAGKLAIFSGSSTKRCDLILSVGSSMDSGKTTTAAYLSRGLANMGHHVSFIKLTGTVYSKDVDLVYDCGAHFAIDFSAFGFPSTYMCTEEELLNLFESLMQKATRIDPDVVIIEIADGILQKETKMLLENKSFMSLIDHIVFSCADSLSALSGIQVLEQMDIYPTALSGLFTASPLLVKEVKANVNIPILTIDELMSGQFNDYLAFHTQKTMINA